VREFYQLKLFDILGYDYNDGFKLVTQAWPFDHLSTFELDELEMPYTPGA
jgi:hypothetical protein